MSEAREIYNTHGQLNAAGGGVCICPNMSQGRGPSRQHGWHLSVVKADGMPHKTDPGGPWYNHGNRVFYPERRDGKTAHEAKAAALETAKAWVAKHLDEPGPWKRNRHMCYVPARINDEYPIPRREP